VSTRNQLLAVWIAIAGAVISGVGLFAAGFLPPPFPGDPAHIVSLYRDHGTRIFIGMSIFVFGAAMVMFFWVPIMLQLQRIEGRRSVLAYIQLALAIIGLWPLFAPPMLMMAAAFRPDRSPEVILALNDAALIPMFGMWAIGTWQWFVMGYAMLQDQTGRIFPRWVGYLTIWDGLSFVAAGLIPLFRTGPFAWNGLIGFWFVTVITASWFGVIFVVLRRAIHNEAESDQREAALAVT
jgi:hypothetical protein